MILFLMPYRETMPEIGKYFFYQFGGFVMGILAVRAIIYTILMAAFIPLAGLGFKKYQVSA